MLKPLYMATRLMCSEEYPNFSGVNPILFNPINDHLAHKATSCPAVAVFKIQIADDLKRRYSLTDSFVLCNDLAMICTFLDPRYKSFPFLSGDLRAVVHENVLSLLTADDLQTQIRQMVTL